MNTAKAEVSSPFLAALSPATLFPAVPDDEEPIRAELFGPESLEVYARQLAAHSTTTGQRPGSLHRRVQEGRLLPRFEQNTRILHRVHEQIIAMAHALREDAHAPALRIPGAGGEDVGGLASPPPPVQREPLPPDAEWLLDNFYIVEETLREIRQDLPPGYYQELPKLAEGPLAGFPRVYALAVGVIAHTDSSLAEAPLARFIQAYQAVTPLTIGELWAVPIMLRLGLVENLRRLAEQMLAVRDDHHRAEEWAARWADSQEGVGPPALPPANGLTGPFLVRALQVLRDQGLPEEVERVQADLASLGVHVTEVVKRENQRQAVNQVSVGNCVTSLRLLGAVDWKTFFEGASRVEALLRRDPAGVYPRQDFATRDRYRQTIEKLARRSGHSEEEVTQRALALALRCAGDGQQKAEATGQHTPANHVGYYLIDAGRVVLQAELGYRPECRERLLETVLAHPQLVYFGLITIVTCLLVTGLVLLTGVNGLTWPWLLLILAALLPASELAVFLANDLLRQLLPPRVLPKLELKDGIPPDCDTFVVIPCLLARPTSASELLERLEIHYLANPDPKFRFALLTDFTDAPAAQMPADDETLRMALDGIQELNRRYRPDGPPCFFLFHRARRWNSAQGCWMGWERKRGKLSEFNRLLRGAGDTSYTVCSSDPATLARAAERIRFVITLDSDTQLPRETARRLVGTLAHPLNQPRFDSSAGRVVAGYGVLQPRISYHLDAANCSVFTRIWAGSAGVDPYSLAVSDVYQDLFGAGTFTGKGIYEVDAFEAATGQTFPDNHILSHDLIEGNYARCGLVTDIELFDDFPSRYHAHARREHRWVRGDWQLLPWLGRTVPASCLCVHAGANPTRKPNPLPLLERWKIFDNLRRSLVPPALVLMLVLGWMTLPGSSWLWSGVALVVMTAPLLHHLLSAFVHAPRRKSLDALRGLRHSAPATASQVLIGTVFVADQARLALDAVLRTLARLFFTRRKLLEWETAAATEVRLGAGLTQFCRSMWPASVLALGCALLVLLVRPEALAAASPLLVAWLFSPLVAFWVSRPLAGTRRAGAETPLNSTEREEIRRIARKTWGFFETFVGDEDHWLPPDNFQEDEEDKVAHRTSPTNKGLLLLSTLAAHDLGYLSLGTLLDRLERTFATLDKLERYRGHFYNWYDTLTLQPLQPTYVSTVDSGNLAGCLIAVKQGLLEKLRVPWPGPSLAEGLLDTLGVIEEQLQDAQRLDMPDLAWWFQPLQRALDRLIHQPHPPCGSPDLPEWHVWLREMRAHAEELERGFTAADKSDQKVPQRLQVWIKRFAVQIREIQTEVAGMAPWLGLLVSPEAAHWMATLAMESEEVACRWRTVYRGLRVAFSASNLELAQEKLLADLDWLQSAVRTGKAGFPVADWLEKLAQAVRASSMATLGARCRQLAQRADALASAADFSFLYKPDLHLFAIGYSPARDQLDAASYDLLASEARLASFLAVARGVAPPRHWFQLGRLLTRVRNQTCLVSWGGTMFEYLMPELVMPCYPGTLLAQSRQAAVLRQIEYGEQQGVPWGISESAFSSQNSSFDYQYQAFGVPGLGLKRGLAHDLVIAPYATALAATVQPRAALINFHRLAAEGAVGPHGFYEAIDYTANRLPEGRRCLVVRSYMAHHQGMSLVALANCLLGNPMPRRFRAEPMVRATELLLQERMPRSAPLIDVREEEAPARTPQTASVEGVDPVSRRLTTAATPGPRTHLLSNGRYTVMVTNAGAGFSTYRRSGGLGGYGSPGINLDVTRWREDYTRDAWGQFFYIRDLESGLVWSAGDQPVCRAAEEYEVVYSADKADFRRVDNGIAAHLEITVAPEQNAEVRRLTLTNYNSRACDLEVTSYAEVVLAPHSADLADPESPPGRGGKLFLETEWVPVHQALLCCRRPACAEQQPVWAVHVFAAEGSAPLRVCTPGHTPSGSRHAAGQRADDEIQFETDRARFLGRGRTPANPAALDPGADLSGTTGSMLDPIFSLRKRIRLAPGVSVTLAFSTAVADTREEALALAGHYRDPHAVLRAFELAWTHSQVELRHHQMHSGDAHLYQRLATHLLLAGPLLRGDSRRVPAACAQRLAGQWGARRLEQSGLWRHGIGRDRPLALVTLGDPEHLVQIRQLLAAHAYWRLRGLEVDLVILNEQPGHSVELQPALQHLIRNSAARALVDRPGGIFLLEADQVEEDRQLLQALARVVLKADCGPLARQLESTETPAELPAFLIPQERAAQTTAGAADLHLANGGGFTPDGREYVVCPVQRVGGAGLSRPDASPVPICLPPAPWVNVVANPSFGFLISETGSGFTWAGNSQTNRLTPGYQDPVSDPSGEVVYLRDEITGAVWTPTPLPLGMAFPTRVRHGQGHTVFEQQGPGLVLQLTLFVPREAPVKVTVLKIRNQTDQVRHLSATFYAEWVLGTVRDQAPMRVVTQLDPVSGALLARNPFNEDFATQVAFANISLRPRTLTADRTEFLGRNGSTASPAALRRVCLSGRVGARLDPCAALQALFELRPEEEKQIVFLLGAAPDLERARQYAMQYQEANQG